jgi:hypothetical protein
MGLIGPSQNSQTLNFDCLLNSASEMSASLTRVSMPVKGLQRLEAVNHEKDFAFIVGNERYPCPSFVAEFLSPRVSSLRSQDITMDEFSIETADPNHYFGSLLELGFGHEISLTKPELSFVRSVCGELRNSERFEQTLLHEAGQLRDDELKARLDFMSGLEGSCDCDSSIIASHFHELSVSDFDRLSPSVLESILRDPKLVVRDEDSVFEIIHRRASSDLSYFGLLEFVRFEFVSVECMERALEFISNSFESFTIGIWSSLRTRLTLSVTAPSQPDRFAPLPPIDSKIISSIPEIFSTFGCTRFRLLYRGSRDGFEANTFHSLCDGHSNTVTLILSANDCIFGGYTPIAWRSSGGVTSDPSLSSFIFTIKTPHNLPSQIFKQTKADKAIYNDSSYGPIFAGYSDLGIADQCQNSSGSWSNLGVGYINDTGIDGKNVLTGSYNFTVKEIEVFELI